MSEQALAVRFSSVLEWKPKHGTEQGCGCHVKKGKWRVGDDSQDLGRKGCTQERRESSWSTVRPGAPKDEVLSPDVGNTSGQSRRETVSVLLRPTSLPSSGPSLKPGSEGPRGGAFPSGWPTVTCHGHVVLTDLRTEERGRISIRSTGDLSLEVIIAARGGSFSGMVGAETGWLDRGRWKM